MKKEIFILSAKRTPIGGFLGSLAGFSAAELGAIAIKNTVANVSIKPEEIESVYMGNVLSANLGQAPARQAAKFAGLSDYTDCTTVNKVCASGMKSVILAAQQIQTGLEHLNVAGGMESMSNVPHYAPIRKQTKMGNEIFTDGLLKDGLTDAYHHFHMGNAAEMCVKKFNITREEQDAFALQSYAKAAKAQTDGKFNQEMIQVELSGKNGTFHINYDEDVSKILPEKVSKLKPTFQQDGTITAANASNLNDGAAAVLLASGEFVSNYQLKPLAKIIAYADASLEPEWFSLAPSEAIKKTLQRAELTLADIDFFEINEAYAAVVLANQSILGIDPGKVNKYGGAVAMGHPLGASGTRILCTLLSVLKQENGKFGMAAICNGGGGSTAILIENLNT